MHGVDGGRFYPLNAEHLSDLIDGSIGEGSMFHERYQYYAQGVDSTTAVLPKGWEGCLIRLQSKETNDRIGYCIDSNDLFLSKCVANRDKDREFNKALLKAGLVKEDVVLNMVELLPVPDERKRIIKALILRLNAEALSGAESSTHAVDDSESGVK